MPPEIESCCCQVVDTHDIFYVHMVLQNHVGRVDHFMNQRFHVVPPGQVYALVQEIVRACKRAKHLKKQFSRSQLEFDRDAVERKHRLARPEMYATLFSLPVSRAFFQLLFLMRTMHIQLYRKINSWYWLSSRVFLSFFLLH